MLFTMICCSLFMKKGQKNIWNFFCWKNFTNNMKIKKLEQYFTNKFNSLHLVLQVIEPFD